MNPELSSFGNLFDKNYLKLISLHYRGGLKAKKISAKDFLNIFFNLANLGFVGGTADTSASSFIPARYDNKASIIILP
jgi:hypothetical protein